MKARTINNVLLIIMTISVLYACSPADGNHPGHEFMPDMAHSIAYEANHYTYYSLNTWGDEADYKKYAMPRLPVEGTQPRTKSRTNPQISNGKQPYYYVDTEEDRTRAMAEIINNPFPIVDAELNKAKALYDIYCGICHGSKGDGEGYLVREDGGVYPAQPANLINEEFTSASNGRYYHAIMYGKNVMGGYADKLSYEERWQVIHYIRSLQAKANGLAYNENENTLNDVDVPLAQWSHDDESPMNEGETHESETHEDHGHDDHNEESH